MRHFIFKSPRRPGDRHLEELSYEPTEFIIEQKALKYGNIVIVSEEEIRNEHNSENNPES